MTVPFVLGMEDLPHLSTLTAIGIAVAISGNVLISLALNLQKLAHKRLDKQKQGLMNGSLGTMPHSQSLSSPPSLNEQDEDTETITNHFTPERPRTPASETQPLLPVHSRNGNLTTFERDDQTFEAEPRKTSLLLRLFRSKKDHGKKRRTTLLPIDVMAEDAALHGIPTRKTTSDEDDENEDEIAYLRSKLWYVTCLLLDIFCNHLLGGMLSS